MIKMNLRKQTGIGLLEVLIAVLVVALGLLVLAKLQGTLMKSSGDTKAHSEAISLAQQKIEELRAPVELENASDTGYTDLPALVAGTYSETVTGTNASFTREWTVTNETSFLGASAPPRKEVSLKIYWTGVDGTTQTVYAETELAWDDPGKSALYSTGGNAGTAAVPSPRQNASEDVASEKVFNVPDSTIKSGSPGTSSTLTLNNVTSLPDSGGTTYTATNVVLTQIAPNSHYYATDNTSWFFVDPGVIAVFKCEGTSCTYIQNHFGGVVLRISGTVSSMSGDTLSNIEVVWSSSDVNSCYQDSTYSTSTVLKTGYNGNSTTMQTMNYECVFAGNCDATTRVIGVDGIGQGNGCSTNVTDAQIASRNVGPGGEFGEVGLLGVDYQGGDREQVCFLEDTADHTSSQNVLTSGAQSSHQYVDNYILPVTKRSYVVRRRNADDTESSEGINQSFTNHNFLILDHATGGGTSETCADLVALNSANTAFEVAPRKIVRTLSSDNSVGSELTYAGGTGPAITLTGTVSASTDLNLYVSATQANNTEPGSCYIKSDGSAYACIVPSGTTTVTVEGANDAKPSASTAYSSCSNAAVAGSGSISCDWTANFSP